MTDSIAVLPPGFRVTDANGAPVSGAKLKFFAAGTSTPLTVYSDSTLGTSLGTEVTCDSAGYPTSDGNAKTLVYTGTSSLKITITDSADVTIAEHDNVRAATDTSSFSGGGSGTWSTSVTSNTTDFTVSTSNDAGELKNCDPSGGNFTATLPSAVTAGDGFRVGFRHAGTANQVLIATVSGQAIKLPGGSTAAGFALTGLGHTAWLVSDGAGWTVDLETKPLGDGIIVIADRLTAPPDSPTPGARYLLNGTPSGDFAPFSEHDIVEADGQGGWIGYTPGTDAGWLAYVQDENLLVQFRDSAWVDLDNITAPAASDLKIATYSHTEASGTNGGLVSSLSSWTTRKMNTVNADTIGITESGASDYEFTIPVGTYLFFGWQHHANGGLTQIRFANADQSVQVLGASRSNSSDILMIQGILEVTTEEAFSFEYNRAANGNTRDLGTAVSKGTEVYAQFTLVDLSSIQGPQGSQGAQGPSGPGYQATSTTSLAIGTGSKAFTTQSGLAYTAGARVKAASAADTNNYMAGVVASYSGTTLTVTVDDTGGSGTFADWNINISGETGEDGAAGGTGAAAPLWLDFNWESDVSGDPGSGACRVDNATYPSLSSFAISDTDRLGNDVAAFIAALDDSDNTTKAIVRIVDVLDATKWLALTLDAALSDQGAYVTFAASHVASGSALTDGNRVSVLIMPYSNKGADGAGSGDVTAAANITDNRIVRGDGGSKGIQESAVTIDDSGNITGVGTVDGRDIATDGTKLDGIEASADVTDATNVAAAGAIMDGDFSSNGLMKRTGAGAYSTAVAGTDYEAADADILRADTADVLTAGFAGTPHDAGTKSSGTFTPDEADGNFQYAVNGGAHTLAPPTNNCSLVVQYTNNGSAGTVTTTGFTQVTGDTISTTNGDDFFFYITKNNSFSHLHVTALQ